VIDKISLAKNTIYSAITSFTSFFLLVLLILAGRYLGDANYGIFTFSLAFVFVVEIFTDFGLSELSQRSITRDKDLASKYLGNLLVWKLIVSTVVFAVLVLAINLLKSSPETRFTVYLLGFANILRSFKSSCRALFRAFERFDLDCLTMYIERSALLVVGIIVIIMGGGLVSFALVFVGVRVFDLALTFGILNWKIVKIVPKFNFTFLKKLQIEALPFGLFFVIITLYAYIDTVMLSLIRMNIIQDVVKVNAEVGWYNAAYKIYEGLTVFPFIICAVIYPRLSQLFVTNKKAHSLLSSRVAKYMFIISFPIVICGIIISKDIINITFGEKFQNSVDALQILLVGIVFVFQIRLFHIILNSVDKQKVVMYIGFVGLIVNVLLNFLLIPRYGFRGAAATTVMSELIVFGAYYFYFRRSYFQVSIWKSSLKPLFASLIVGSLVWKFNALPLSLLLLLIFSLYPFLLFCFRTFDRQERDLVYRLIKITR